MSCQVNRQKLWATNGSSSPPEKNVIACRKQQSKFSYCLQTVVCLSLCGCVGKREFSVLAAHGTLGFYYLGSPFNSSDRKWNTRMTLLQSGKATCNRGHDILQPVFPHKGGWKSHRCMPTVWHVAGFRMNVYRRAVWSHASNQIKNGTREEHLGVYWGLTVTLWAVNAGRVHSTGKASCLSRLVNTWTHSRRHCI